MQKQEVVETEVTKKTDEAVHVEQPRKLTETFVYMDKTEQVLNVAMETGKNVILFGKGGYGKSEFTLDFLREHGIEPYVMTMGSGMTTDRLFGGMDLKKFNETGKLEYLVENSFMNSEYVVFEELFDAPDFILEQLKDILSSGVFRNGSQIFEIKTKLIICCTNRTREEFSKNNSLKALMERFPLELEVKWEQHNRITYENLLNKKMGFADPLLTYILEQFAIAGSTISPRIALAAQEIIDTCGPDCLYFVADLNVKPELLKQSVVKFQGMLEIENLRKDLAKLSKEFSEIDLSSSDGLKKGGQTNAKIFSAVTKLKSIKSDDSIITTTTELIKTFQKQYDTNKKNLELLNGQVS
jgi:hypothetical protein